MAQQRLQQEQKLQQLLLIQTLQSQAPTTLKASHLQLLKHRQAQFLQQASSDSPLSMNVTSTTSHTLLTVKKQLSAISTVQHPTLQLLPQQLRKVTHSRLGIPQFLQQSLPSIQQ
jgi:hypothetical protein